jgi:hypothetical protein
MASISKIPSNVNRYAIKCCYEIRNKPFEYLKGLNFANGNVTTKSKYIKGTTCNVTYNFSKNPKAIILHNHPFSLGSSEVISLMDLYSIIFFDTKKIFASSPEGFTSMDLTTVKKTKTEMLIWLYNKIINWQDIKKNIYSTRKKKKIYYNQIKEFADFSGAIFSDVKWSDYSKMNSIKQQTNIILNKAWHSLIGPFLDYL